MDGTLKFCIETTVNQGFRQSASQKLTSYRIFPVFWQAPFLEGFKSMKGMNKVIGLPATLPVFLQNLVRN